MVWDPQKPKISLLEPPPLDLILAHLVCKKADFGVKKSVFLKNAFSHEMTFLGSSDHFSLGSKWFWYLQNDKLYTLGPTESPNGQWGQKGSQKGQKWPPRPYLAHLAYFGLFFWAQA